MISASQSGFFCATEIRLVIYIRLPPITMHNHLHITAVHVTKQYLSVPATSAELRIQTPIFNRLKTGYQL